MTPAFSITNATSLRAMSQDAEVYPDPQYFRPERFMPKTHNDTTLPPDPRSFVFGFSRSGRICPGKQFADSNIWLVAASMIATVKILKALDDSGKEITPPAAFASSFIRYGS
jgi:cytochrome P450